jgi:hypothetical protein
VKKVPFALQGLGLDRASNCMLDSVLSVEMLL